MSYIGNVPAESFLTLERQVFTTSATDTYTLDRSVSSPNDIELFLNNVRQQPVEAYNISGTTLTLASAITASDTMYCIYQGRAVNSNNPAPSSVTGDMLVKPFTYDDASDGSVTGISVNNDYPTTSTASAGTGSGIRFGVNDGSFTSAFGDARGSEILSVTQQSNGRTRDIVFKTDNGGTLGEKMRILASGGITFNGDTASANALDDYEEGTFTPTAQFAASQPTAGATSGVGSYTKVGNMVTVWGAIENFNVTGASGDLRIRDLPFTSTSDDSLGGYQGTAQVSRINYNDNCYVTAEVPDGLSYVRLAESIDNNARDFINVANCSHGESDVYFCVTYKTG